MKSCNQSYPWYDLPEISSFAELLEMQSAKSPEKPAFIFTKNKQELTKTRKAFEQDVGAFALYLKEQGFSGSRIAIAAANCYEWIVIFTAANFIHATIVPLNPGISASELCDLIEQSESRAVYASKSVRRLLQNGVSVPMLEIEGVEEAIASALAKDPDLRGLQDYIPDPDHIAAIFYTSGTTGIPKGVMLSEKNLCSDINASCHTFQLSGSTVAFLPFYHSFGLMTSIYMAYNWNGTIWIARNMRRLVNDIQNARPETICAVPLVVQTIHKRILEGIRKQNKEPQVRKAMKLAGALEKVGIDVRDRFFSQIQQQLGGHLRFLICGGAALDEQIVEDLHAWGIQVLRGYGITEGSPVLAVNRNHWIKKNSVGICMPGIEAKVSPEGELMFAGDMIFQGYWNMPDESAKALENGWLRTGDLGTIDQDGFIWITGRSKNLIILANGENISPEQIEQLLQQQEGIDEAIVFEHNNQLCAIIHPDGESEMDQAKMNEAIKAYNLSQPSDRQIVRSYLHPEPFDTNAMHKTLRKQVIEKVLQTDGRDGI